MSWNKNTINLSKLDIIASTLDSAGIKYEVKELGQVKAIYVPANFLSYQIVKREFLDYE